MAAYKSQLREYRALQEELGPWTQAFKAQNGRKPCLVDVERTGKLITLASVLSRGQF